MLVIPTKLISSLRTKNLDQTVLCDWIEASLLLTSVSIISKSDVNDLLIENFICTADEDYDSSITGQDYAAFSLEEAWVNITNRINNLNEVSGISLNNENQLIRNSNSALAHRFFLALSCKQIYPEWTRSWESDATEYGELFEQLSKISVAKIFNGWVVNRIGWGSKNTAPLREDVDKLIGVLREVSGAEIDAFITTYTKDMGLDLVAYRPFHDNLPTLPIMLFQCASGLNWRQKLNTPDLHKWSKVISFSSQPLKALTIPFAFLDAHQFRMQTMELNGVVLERYRLLQGLSEIEDNLAIDLESWLSKVTINVPQ
jgi:hypothetical protein